MAVSADDSRARGYRDLSLWHDTCDDEWTPRASLPGDDSVDVAIVGAGYTGLWTAYYLRRLDPSLRVVVIEREVAGFGASGRNGGWCSALFAGSGTRAAREHGRAGAVELQRALVDTVDEVGRVTHDEGIDAHFAKGGTIAVATRAAHVARLRAEVAAGASSGLGEEGVVWLGAAESSRRIATAENLGAAFTPHCAAIHPARLVRGLARVVEAAGVPVRERTEVVRVAPRTVTTTHGTVRADVVVRATEAFTVQLPGRRRSFLPVYSLMVATEPLPGEVWETIGLRRRETFTDGRHLLVYGQRTADGRLAFGGRGAPYHFGSRVSATFDRDARAHRHVEAALRELLPAARDACVTHRWGGAVAVPRDWYSSVGHDRRTGDAWAGGYVGDGVGASNLAGRTLADLVLGRDTALVRLPWVGHRSPAWEPEPLRFVGVNLGVLLTASIDRAEAAGRTPRRRAALLRRLLGTAGTAQ
jgi:glycine/D-amino acid oxidase-like deaminating enzyme